MTSGTPGRFFVEWPRRPTCLARRRQVGRRKPVPDRVVSHCSGPAPPLFTWSFRAASAPAAAREVVDVTLLWKTDRLHTGGTAGSDHDPGNSGWAGPAGDTKGAGVCPPRILRQQDSPGWRGLNLPSCVPGPAPARLASQSRRCDPAGLGLDDLYPEFPGTGRSAADPVAGPALDRPVQPGANCPTDRIVDLSLLGPRLGDHSG